MSHLQIWMRLTVLMLLLFFSIDIEKAAEISNWNYKTDYNGSGKGIGFAQYKNIKCFAAVIVDLEVNDFGNIKLKEATIVADAGKIIDP